MASRPSLYGRMTILSIFFHIVINARGEQALTLPFIYPSVGLIGMMSGDSVRLNLPGVASHRSHLSY